MGLILKQIYAFFKLLNSDTGNVSISLGMTCGFILGMTPVLSIHCLLVFLILFFFRIQIGAATIMAFFFKLIAFILDPLFDVVGRHVLEMDSLQGFFTTLFNMPIVPYTRFNNSIVMGSAVVTFALAPFIYILCQKFIIKYREVVVERFKNSKYWKIFQATKIFEWYSKYDRYRSA